MIENIESNSDANFVLLSLGANIGNKLQTLKSAIELLQNKSVLVVEKQSSYYLTEPYGIKDQDWFVNVSIAGKTTLSPTVLLAQCKEIEVIFGRKKRHKWHERELDVDIILYNGLELKTKELTIPHMEYKKRNFVLIPSAEIVGELVPCDSEMNISDLATICNDTSGIRKID
jgi:2-amino-4-hydroxy-6-hydroxymethyldihydropteridine diphosphokinase